jgi:IS605 OrfB family transposase
MARELKAKEMKMRLVERHVISRTDPRSATIDRAAFAAKNLYNAANYEIRQAYIFQGISLNYHEMCQRMKDQEAYKKDHEAYKVLPAKVAQQVLHGLDQNWQNYFAALAAWNDDPSKFLDRPHLPRYKEKQKGRHLLVYTIQTLSVPALRGGLIRPSMLEIAVKTKQQEQTNQQVRIIPRTSCYFVEVVYERALILATVNPALCAGVDIGLTHLATLTANKPGFIPRTVNGRTVKSANQYYNKRRAELRSRLGEAHTSQRLGRLTTKRTRRIDHYLHTASRRLIDLLLAEGIGTLVIGQNPLWKQQVRLGQRTNRSFVGVPHARFIKMLRFKAELVGIRVLVTEESYTSKASFLDADPLPIDDPAQPAPIFSGKRTKRSLYRAADGRPIQADVNGAYNIIRNVAPEAFAQGSRGCVVHPVRLAV